MPLIAPNIEGAAVKQKGFTLIELIIVIVISSIVGVMVSLMIGRYMDNYITMEKRVDMTQIAESALQKMAADIHNAVPNSVRVNGNYIEMVPVVYAAPYRKNGDFTDTAIITNTNPAEADPLDFTVADKSFHVLANIVSADTPLTSAQVVIYNTGLTNAGAPVCPDNLYADPSGCDPHIISRPGLTITDNIDQDFITLDTPRHFARQSPYRKVYIVDGALTYHCDLANGTLTRYSGYAIQESQPPAAGVAPLTGGALVANNLTGCAINYSAGSLSRNAVVSLVISLGDGNQSTTLMKQVQISNVP